MLTDAIAPDLPSRVEETLATCPRFRIVLIGNVGKPSGVGKSSLISSIFNISLNDIDIAHNRPGRAEITHGYTSGENPRFVLHDSQGFEAGSTGNWNTVENFLRESSAKELQDRVHAIWLCIEAPREGSRLQQTGDEKLLSLAKELDIPVIIVFTKYDNLLKEQRYLNDKKKGNLSEAELLNNAETCFNERIKEFKTSHQASIVKVSTDKNYPSRFETLLKLTQVTRISLPGSGTEEGASVSYVAAQRISARQKVEISVSEGFKKYWRHLGKSFLFQEHTMNQCVYRIHDDILKVWNFNDPRKLLLQEDFFTKMIQLVSPVLEGHETEVQPDDMLGKVTSALVDVLAGEQHIQAVATIAQISILGAKFLYGRYKKIPLTAGYLGVYIVDLTCILHRLFLETLKLEPPRALSKELISTVVENYREIDAWNNHQLVFQMNFAVGFEDKIKDLIYDTLRDTDDLPQFTYPPQSSGNIPPVSVPQTSQHSTRQQDSERRDVRRKDKCGCCIVV